MNRQFNTDCEGPISRNDNAFELAQQFIPRGGEFFAKLSRYDDFLADVARKSGYKAGDTLKLILPFLKAYGATDLGIREFSYQNVLLVPGADAALEYIRTVMPAFIISTSYRPYINALCELTGFPAENTYCTELALDKFQIPGSEMAYLKKLHAEIQSLPSIQIPESAASREDMDDESIRCIDRLDAIFWKELSNMASGKLFQDVNPIGGFEKAEAVERSCERTALGLENVMYVGDSITDVEAMTVVKNAGGLAVSFNGNRYAIQSADVACISPRALITAALALVFREGGVQSVRTLASEWNTRKITFENTMRQSLPGFSVEDTDLHLIDDSNQKDIVSRSESFRKTVRGERIGRLG